MDIYNDLSSKYNTFIYKDYKIEELENKTKITYEFSIPNLTNFYPTLVLDKFEINNFTKYLIFHIGLIELISYWKCTCSKNVIIEAGYINEDQMNFFKKLYYYGLGELLYTNGIKVEYEDFMNIKCTHKNENVTFPKYNGNGNLIPIGGGKDSNVTLEILKNENNSVFMINPKSANLNCASYAGYTSDKTIIVKRVLDKKLLDLNKEGFINGHTPFSSLVAFISYLSAYTNNKKYIVLSNESSANESNVKGTKVNHQYSKTYEFENDFNNYTKTYFKIDIKYFSLLRPLSEYQIAYLFSHYDKYHKIFRSCNVGSKKEPWMWCNNCPKCLFVFIMLSPFLYKNKLIAIFNEDLYEKKELLSTFIDLIGYGNNKPFECVGTYEEIRYAITKLITELDKLPYLLQYYKNNYQLEDLENNLLNNYNKENNLPKYFDNLLKEELNKYEK